MKIKPYLLEIVSGAAVLACSAYYIYHLGWWGLLYSVLASAFGFMIITYFGNILPIIGPLLRRWEGKSSGHKDQ